MGSWESQSGIAGPWMVHEVVGSASGGKIGGGTCQAESHRSHLCHGHRWGARHLGQSWVQCLECWHRCAWTVKILGVGVLVVERASSFAVSLSATVARRQPRQRVYLKHSCEVLHSRRSRRLRNCQSSSRCLGCLTVAVPHSWMGLATVSLKEMRLEDCQREAATMPTDCGTARCVLSQAIPRHHSSVQS